MLEGLSYDDVMLVPQQGVLDSRKDADLTTELIPGWPLELPIVSANMPTVTGPEMAIAMSKLGGVGFLHRFNTQLEAVSDYLKTSYAAHWAIPSIGLDDYERLDAFVRAGARAVCLDVAHGDHKRVVEFLDSNPWRHEIAFIVGNVATRDGAHRLLDCGVQGIKVGVGPGAACTTREVTGFGVPQLTAIFEVRKAIEDFGYTATLIADGGIKNSGDIVKALAAGADTVMVGRLLAGTTEAATPGYYAGNASEHVKAGYRAPEGVHGEVTLTGPVEDTIKRLSWGIRSGLSYGGAKNLYELRGNAEWVKVTHFTSIESGTRL